MSLEAQPQEVDEVCELKKMASSQDPAEAIKRELPMELLRASVPHTNDYQKKMMYDLSQRSLVGEDGGRMNSESVFS